MGFWPIFRKTIIDLTGWKRMALLTVITIVPASVIPDYGWRSSTKWPLQLLTHDAINGLLVVSFVWISGFFLAYFISANTAGSIAKEINDGSMLILIGRTTRRKIILAKFAALVIVSALMEIILLLLLTLILRLVIPLNEDTQVALLKALLWLIPYSIIIVLFFGAISMALSALTTRLVPIMIILSCLIMGSFLVGPVVRQVWPSIDNSSYVRYHMYSVDPSYHLSNTFAVFQKQASEGRIPPISSTYAIWLSGGGVLQPASPITTIGQEMEFYYPVKPIGHVNPLVSMAVLLLVSAVALGAAVFIVDHKDIN